MMVSVRWYNASAHYALSLAQGLRRAGQRVVLFGIPSSPVIIRAQEIGLESIESIDLMRGTAALRHLRHFRRTVAERGIDIVHPHFSRDHTFAACALLGAAIPIVRTRSESIPPRGNVLNRFFYRRAAQHYALPARYLKPTLRRMGIADDRISVIPLSMDARAFSRYTPSRDLKGALGIRPGSTVISYVGRLHAIKGVEYLIRSYPLLENKSGVHFVISGEEVDVSRRSLADLARKLGCQRISVIDRCDDVREILSITDIGVIPSVGSEAICRVALEMLSFGIPIVGSNLNAIPEAISDYEGILVTPGRPDEIAGALDRLIFQEEYRRRRERILQKISSISLDCMVNGYLGIYQQLL